MSVVYSCLHVQGRPNMLAQMNCFAARRQCSSAGCCVLHSCCCFVWHPPRVLPTSQRASSCQLESDSPDAAVLLPAACRDPPSFAIENGRWASCTNTAVGSFCTGTCSAGFMGTPRGMIAGKGLWVRPSSDVTHRLGTTWLVWHLDCQSSH